MNIPALKTFEVESRITNFLNKKFDEYQKDFPFLDSNPCFRGKGYLTGNLLEWKNEEYNDFRKKELLNLIYNFLEIDNFYQIQISFNHMMKYGKGNSMACHNHLHNEDFVMFIYLNDCDDGHTQFYLNETQPKYKERTSLKIQPKKNTGVFFHAGISHEGLPTNENKKIFVTGIRIDLS